MIVLDRKVIYIKIPKTASTSVASEIWSQYAVERTQPHDVVINLNFYDHANIGPYGWHVKYRRIEEYLGGEIADYSVFTVIREPIDRILSVYRWAVQKNPNQPLLRSLNAFLHAVEARDPSLPKQAQIHAEPQVEWLCDRSNAVPDSLRIFTLEQLDGLAEWMRDALAFPPRFKRVNVSEPRPISMDSQAREIVNRLYAHDIELYSIVRGSSRWA